MYSWVSLMTIKPSAESLTFKICDVKLNLYLSSSLHLSTRLNASTSTIAAKVRWQMLSSFSITRCRKRCVAWRELQPRATIAATMQAQASWRDHFKRDAYACSRSYTVVRPAIQNSTNVADPGSASGGTFQCMQFLPFFYLFFLPVLSRPSFTSRTPNKDQKTEELFYFL